MKKLNRDEILKKARVEGFDSLSMDEIYKYPGTGGKKFKVELGRGTGISPLGKLVAKNANRSIIKRDRQQAKSKIRKDIE